MQNWDQIRTIIVDKLRNQQYTHSGNDTKTPCFLTAYQIAVLVDKDDEALKEELPIGGAGVGPNSFARQIAWNLSADIKNDIFGGKLERQFLSCAGLDSFDFNGKHEPSAEEFSMFRYVE